MKLVELVQRKFYAFCSAYMDTCIIFCARAQWQSCARALYFLNIFTRSQCCIDYRESFIPKMKTTSKILLKREPISYWRFSLTIFLHFFLHNYQSLASFFLYLDHQFTVCSIKMCIGLLMRGEAVIGRPWLHGRQGGCRKPYELVSCVRACINLALLNSCQFSSSG
jgi:hypothetical protein